jgi:hypothetical protein
MSYGPTPLRVVHWGSEAILGGGCSRFGCGHTFAQHDMGDPGRSARPERDGQPAQSYVPASGGKCNGRRDPFNDGGRPCDCTQFQSGP